MHSGDIATKFPRPSASNFPFFPFFSLIREKILDGDFPIWYSADMSKHVIKVDKAGGTFRINIPKTIIQRWRWFNVDYVILDDANDDYLILRRLIYGEASPTENKRYSPG